MNALKPSASARRFVLDRDYERSRATAGIDPSGRELALVHLFEQAVAVDLRHREVGDEDVDVSRAHQI